MNTYLEYLKWQEFEATRGYFLPAKPIEKVLDKIKQSDVYRVLKKLPKGGNMHLHQSKKLEVSFEFSSYIIKGKETAKIRNRYNQIPHLT